MVEKVEKTVEAYYEQDSKRYHRYKISENSLNLVGTIYVPKSKEIPKEFSVVLKVSELENS